MKNITLLITFLFITLLTGCASQTEKPLQTMLDRQKLCQERGHIPYCLETDHPHAETGVYDNDTMSYKIWWKFERKEFICERCSKSWVEEKELSVDTIVFWNKPVERILHVYQVNGNDYVCDYDSASARKHFIEMSGYNDYCLDEDCPRLLTEDELSDYTWTSKEGKYEERTFKEELARRTRPGWFWDTE